MCPLSSSAPLINLQKLNTINMQCARDSPHIELVVDPAHIELVVDPAHILEQPEGTQAAQAVPEGSQVVQMGTGSLVAEVAVVEHQDPVSASSPLQHRKMVGDLRWVLGELCWVLGELCLVALETKTTG